MAKTIKTIQGDTWDMLSKRAYGDEVYMHVLINANIAHRKTVIFPADVVLSVPDIDTSVAVYDESMPIWKRMEGME